MTADIRLTNDEVIAESTYLKVVGPAGTALELDGQVARLRNDVAAPGDRRRALVHASGDQLVINYDGDYRGGVVLHGGESPIQLDANQQIRLGAPQVLLTRGSRLLIEHTTSSTVSARPGGRTGGMVVREDATVDVLSELLALRKELNDLKTRLGVL